MTIVPGGGAYWFEGNEVGCLLVHGFTGTPQNVRPLADYLARRGLAVSAPRLPGHGTTVEDLDRTGPQDWLAAAEKASRSRWTSSARGLLARPPPGAARRRGQAGPQLRQRRDDGPDRTQDRDDLGCAVPRPRQDRRRGGGGGRCDRGTAAPVRRRPAAGLPPRAAASRRAVAGVAPAGRPAAGVGNGQPSPGPGRGPAPAG